MNKLKSKFEERIVEQLKDIDGIKWFYEPIQLEYYETKKYTPDLLIEVGDKAILIEMKGYFRASDRSKMKAIKTQYPDMDIKMLFQNSSNRLNKNSKMTYGDWCDKYNIEWAEGEIPLDWLKE